jgi:hypothetical protein
MASDLITKGKVVDRKGLMSEQEAKRNLTGGMGADVYLCGDSFSQHHTLAI